MSHQATRVMKAIVTPTAKLMTLTGVHAQPGVDDKEITQLVEEKVDAFWRGVEGGANKRGQVRTLAFSLALFSIGPSSRSSGGGGGNRPRFRADR